MRAPTTNLVKDGTRCLKNCPERHKSPNVAGTSEGCGSDKGEIQPVRVPLRSPKSGPQTLPYQSSPIQPNPAMAGRGKAAAAKSHFQRLFQRRRGERGGIRHQAIPRRRRGLLRASTPTDVLGSLRDLCRHSCVQTEAFRYPRSCGSGPDAATGR